uniref:trihelix transcription factor ASIL2 n=1 Tax=Erigeron canadensis TaxID=72917 RepID=UPI001CB980E7|nr:trihelix transcription factor ASIL2 [Erigeron canadensis]
MDNNNNKPTTQQNHDPSPSPKKPPSTAPAATITTAGGSGGGGDRLKRDEWSEGAVSCLLEAYEAKWVLRNRAKLKGHDWEDVAKFVSSRANSSKSPKTQTQCKNKIESMKKRYRSESATSDVSSWPLFPRLDLLLRGTGGPPPVVTVAAVASVGHDPPCSHAVPVASGVPLKPFDHPPPVVVQTQPSPAIVTTTTMIQTSTLPVAPAVAAIPVIQEKNSVDSNGVDQEDKEDVIGTKIADNEPSEKMEIESDCSTPAALYSNEKDKLTHKTKIMTDSSRKRRRKGENSDVAESIRWLGKVMVRSEQAKVETMRELEKMRVDAEIKRGEIDLKRTEIIAHTQLEIAKLFAASMGKSVDPSLSIGRS